MIHLHKPISAHGLWLFAMLALLLGACEKPNMTQGGGEPEEKPADGHQIRVTLTLADGMDHGGGTVPLADACTRISYCVFAADGSTYKVWHQLQTSAHFGTYTLSLPTGHYRLAVIAHSGEGNLSCESAQAVKFHANRVTDTFYATTETDVSGSADCPLTLRRVAAAVRVRLTGAMPAQVGKMEFYYTGGSSTLSAVTGRGSVNSRQAEQRMVTADMVGQATQFDIYTFPHADTGQVKLTVRALDASGQVLLSKVYDAVAIAPDTRTILSDGYFDSDTPGGGGTQTDLTIGVETYGGTIAECQ